MGGHARLCYPGRYVGLRHVKAISKKSGQPLAKVPPNRPDPASFRDAANPSDHCPGGEAAPRLGSSFRKTIRLSPSGLLHCTSVFRQMVIGRARPWPTTYSVLLPGLRTRALALLGEGGLRCSYWSAPTLATAAEVGVLAAPLGRRRGAMGFEFLIGGYSLS